jgi:hypothetical protein
MMKKTNLFILCILVYVLSFGQPKTNKATVEWGPTFKLGRGMVFKDIVSYDQDDNLNLLFVEYGYWGYVKNVLLSQVNPNLQYVNPRQIKLYDGEKKLSIIEIVQLKDQVYIFSYFRDNKSKEKTLYYHSYDEKRNIASTPKQLMTLNFEGYRIGRTGEFKVVFSQDRSKALVYYDLPSVDDEPEKFGAMVFDSNMDLLWKNEFTLSYKSGLFDTDQIFMGNNGELFMIARTFRERKPGGVKDPSQFLYLLLSTSDNGSEMNDHIVALKEYQISDLTASMTPQNDIICAGFYTDKKKGSSVKGVFYMLIDDKTKQIEIESIKGFDYEFITEGMSDRSKKKTDKAVAKGKDVEMPDFEFRDIVIKENGGAILLAEQFKVVVVTRTDSRGNMSTSTYYYYRDIILVDINKDGSINWTLKIPKNQVTTNDGGWTSSYVHAVSGDKIYIMFTDHIENFRNSGGVPKIAGTKGKKNIGVALVTVDQSGKMEKELLYTFAESGVPLVAKNSLQNDENEVLLYCNLGGKNRFGRVVFK